MRHFNISYTSYYNWGHHRTGHLYQGRYKSFLVDGDEYLQEVSRYIHLNPMRVRFTSGMALREKREYLRSYRWSSYGGYILKRDRRSFLQGELLKKGFKEVVRGVLMEMLYRYGGMNQREIGELMGIDYSAVSVMRKRLFGLQKGDRNLSAKIDKIKERLRSRIKI